MIKMTDDEIKSIKEDLVGLNKVLKSIDELLVDYQEREKNVWRKCLDAHTDKITDPKMREWLGI